MKILSRPIIIALLFLFTPLCFLSAANPLDVVINEIAWMGTKANSSDEWIELYNNTNQAISLQGWGLYEAGGKTLIEPLTGIIEANSYYLIERTDDTTISDIPASQKPSGWAGSGLNNNGEYLQLRDQNSNIIDEINCSAGWFAGETGPNYKTMERKDSQAPGSDPDNWATNNGSVIKGKDAKGNPINGTPGTKNSVAKEKSVGQSELKIEPETQTEPKPEIIPQEEPQPEPKPIVYPSGILINEILASPEGADDLEEWIELENINDGEVNLSQWKIQDVKGSVTTYTFPEGTKIGPKSFLVLSRPLTKIALNNSGDGLLLIQPNGNILDTVNYEKAVRGQSYNRTDSGWVWSSILTPGKPNEIPPSVLENKKNESSKKTSIEETKKETKIKKELAAIGEQVPKETSFSPFIIALIIAIFSGIIILILKKKIKINYNKNI